VGNDGSAADGHHGVPRGEAWNDCKSAVREKLVNPDTADFTLLSTDFSAKGDGWSITGTLKAKNDFGVEDELAYSCRIDANKNVRARVTP
jgi:hypothetical protein